MRFSFLLYPLFLFICSGCLFWNPVVVDVNTLKPADSVLYPEEAREVGKQKEARPLAKSRYNSEDIVNAAWWGFNENDATTALQSAISSGAGMVVVPYMGKPWYITPVYLESEQTIIFEPGVVVAAKKGAFLDPGHSLFFALDTKNLRLIGNGAVLEMQKADYTKPPYEHSQWRHVLALRGVSNVYINGLVIRKSGGDGIYIRGSSRKKLGYSEYVHIDNVILDNNYRQGISVISADHLLIENTRIYNTNGTNPQAGIDFEPNFPRERFTNIVIRNCEFLNNKGPGLLIYLGNLNTGSQPVDIVVESTRSHNNLASLWIGGLDEKPHGEIRFIDSQFGFYRYLAPDPNLTVQFIESREAIEADKR